MHNVLYFARADESLYALIRNHLPENCRLVTLETGSDEERMEKLKDAEVVVLAGARLERRHIEAARKLRLVNFQGVGYHDAADAQALADHGIPYAIAPGGTAEGVSEHTIMMMIAAYKYLSFMDAEIRKGTWHAHDMRTHCRQIYGKTVGILGFGRIGRAVALRLQPFGVRVIYNDIVDIPGDVQAACKATPVTFNELLERSDILSLHTPLTPETHHLIGRESLSRMQRGSSLINCARGGIVDEAALVEALQSGHIGFAGLDVRESEPPTTPDAFAGFPNVVMTPHVAPGTVDAMNMKMADVFANVRRLLAGEEIQDRVV